jgi:hypothetical protein
MKMKKFIPHKFWIDGVLYRDLETYRDLSTWIIKESMKSNGLTFRKNNKKEYMVVSNKLCKHKKSRGSRTLRFFI